MRDRRCAAERAGGAPLLELGRIVGAWGVRGWVKAVGEAETLAALAAWWVNGERRAVEARRRDGERVLARLAGVATREQAQALSGSVVAAARGELPDAGPGRYYYGDLQDLLVRGAAGEPLGRVIRVFTNGAHEVLAVRDGRRERLLPFVAAVVRRVDLEARTIEVDWRADW